MAKRTYTDPEAKFFAKVYKHPDGCWIWTGARDKQSGYGHMYHEGKYPKAHRLAHMLFIGPIPDGLVIDHLCRNRGCVNPAHLEAVTNRENLRRGKGHGSETHCPQGHPYDEANTIPELHKPSGSVKRSCRTCKRTRNREAKRKAA